MVATGAEFINYLFITNCNATQVFALIQ